MYLFASYFENFSSVLMISSFIGFGCFYF